MDLEGSTRGLIEALPQHFPGQTEENHTQKKTEIGLLVS